MKYNIKHFIPYFLFLSIGAFFFLFNLDNWYLWEDESLYALLSKNILKFGKPSIFDGINVIGHNVDDFSKNTLTYLLYGWLPLYFNALSFYILGISTFSARIVSALSGIMFILYMYWEIIRIKLAKGTPFYSGLLVLFCIPLLLYFRQCQYYAFSIILTFCVFIEFSFRFDKRLNRALFVFFSLCLLNTNLLAWGSMMIWASILTLCSKESFKIKFYILSVNALLSVPFIILYELWKYLGYASGKTIPLINYPYYDRLFYYVNSINIAIVPYWFCVILIFSYIVFHKHFNRNEKTIVVNSSLAVLTALFVIPFGIHFIFFRYIVFIVPFILIIISVIIFRVFSVKPILGVTLLSISIFFNILNFKHDAQDTYYSYLKNFIFEITHDSYDVNEALAIYLNKNSVPGQTVITHYGDFPIIFYTKLKVRGGPGKTGLRNNKRDQLLNIEKVERPDWIVIRQKWKWLYPKDLFESFLEKYEYEEIVLNVEDSGWGNRPSPFYHFFITPIVSSPLKIYKLKN